MYAPTPLNHHTRTRSAAFNFYDPDDFDDAFINEVAKIEANYSPLKSPLSVFSPQTLPQEDIPDVDGRRTMGICGSTAAKKLEFETAVKPDHEVLQSSDFRNVQTWHDNILSSRVSGPSSQMLEAHGELSQEKALLVLSYFPKGDWYKAVDLEELRKYKSMDFSAVDARLRHITCCNKMSKIDWDKKRECYLVFQCEINNDGHYSIKGPFFEQTGSPLQRVFGEGGVLRVHFADMKKNAEVVEGVYRKIAREGIWIGLRHYMFFAYKDPKGKRQDMVEDVSSMPKCFFVCIESHAKWDRMNSRFRQFRDIWEARQYMMHINTVPTLSKAFSRLQLALSQTWPLIDLNAPDVKVEIIEDIYCRDMHGNIVCDIGGEKLIHTDGTGFVSADIASRCRASIFKGKVKVDNVDEEVPLLFQVRLFYKGMVAKGTLLVNLKLPPLTIQIRKSMVKVETDKNLAGPCYNSLEVCNTSRRPGKGKLSPYLGLLLSYGGVPDDVLMKFVNDELKEIQMKLSGRQSALRALKNAEQGDYYDAALRMIMAGVSLEEPYLKKTLFELSKSQLQELSTGRLTIPDCYNLMGCADPTGKLERNQVVIILENGPVYCPKVLVYKSPGLHVGDVKAFEAVWHKEFLDIIGNGKFVIFFSVKGPRSVVDEIANSDLDGDQYWCCTNPQVVSDFVCSEVWKDPGLTKKSNQPKIHKNDEIDKHHFETFLKARFKPSTTMGVAANSWQALMDMYLNLDNHDPTRKDIWCKIQSLVNTYYEAVDAEKTGKQVFVKESDKARRWPHYIEKKQGYESKWIQSQSVYHSKTILGKIYDLVKGQTDTLDLSSHLEKLVLTDTFIEKRFQYPGFETYHKIWDDRFKEYKARISHCLNDNEGDNRNSEADALLQMYRRELYKADTLIDSQEPLDEIFKQASAIYIIVYSQAQKRIEMWIKDDNSSQKFQVTGLQFAWKVAGYALLKLISQQPLGKRKEPVIVEESLFRDLKFARRGD